MNASRLAAAVVGAGRMAVGAWFLARPARPAVTWMGDEEAATRHLVRSVGARDLAIGAGIVAAALSQRDVLGWLTASIVSDLADVAVGAVGLEGSHRRSTVGWGGGAAAIAAATVVAVTVEERRAR